MLVNNGSIREIIKERLYHLKDKELKILDVSDLDTSSVTDMKSLFEEVIVDSIVGLDSWNISNVKSMSGMFKHCRTGRSSSTLALSDLGNWDTSRVTNMWHMFQGCPVMFLGDLSKWDIRNVTNSWAMLSYELNKVFKESNHKLEKQSEEIYQKYCEENLNSLSDLKEIAVSETMDIAKELEATKRELAMVKEKLELRNKVISLLKKEYLPPNMQLYSVKELHQMLSEGEIKSMEAF